MPIQLHILGAGREVGRSCIVASIDGINIVIDCGAHMKYSDKRMFPDFSSYGCSGMELTKNIACVLITHSHLDHVGALPHFTETLGYAGPVYMSYPTKAIAPIILEDYAKVQSYSPTDVTLFDSDKIRRCLVKASGMHSEEEVTIAGKIRIKCVYAGHVLGACMFYIRHLHTNESILYTGDYTINEDNHLGPSRIERWCPDVLISECTYGFQLRETKKKRNMEFCDKILQHLQNKGRVLIPVFAVGRAQELASVLSEYFLSHNVNHGLFYGGISTEKAFSQYENYSSWTNEDNFQHGFSKRILKPYNPSLLTSKEPCVIFASPGMLHGGLSLQVLRAWAHDENALILIPGFCTAGSVGSHLQQNKRQIVLQHGERPQEIQCTVASLSFCSHVDAKGILEVIQHTSPKNVVFVHGDSSEMLDMKKYLTTIYNIDCFCPNNEDRLVFSKLKHCETSLAWIQPYLFNKLYKPFTLFRHNQNKQHTLKISQLKETDSEWTKYINKHSYFDDIDNYFSPFIKGLKENREKLVNLKCIAQRKTAMSRSFAIVDNLFNHQAFKNFQIVEQPSNSPLALPMDLYNQFGYLEKIPQFSSEEEIFSARYPFNPNRVEMLKIKIEGVLLNDIKRAIEITAGALAEGGEAFLPIEKRGDHPSPWEVHHGFLINDRGDHHAIIHRGFRSILLSDILVGEVNEVNKSDELIYYYFLSVLRSIRQFQ